jgi:hypothetical protein
MRALNIWALSESPWKDRKICQKTINQSYVGFCNKYLNALHRIIKWNGGISPVERVIKSNHWKGWKSLEKPIYFINEVMHLARDNEKLVNLAWELASNILRWSALWDRQCKIYSINPQLKLW